jgi:general secretion pathway protein G
MQKHRRHNRTQHGFTLIELLVVLAIIGMLAGLVGPQVVKHLGESKTKTAKLQIEELSSALDMYRLDVGRYPATEEGLAALIEQPSNAKIWNGPYLRKKKVPVDPWNNPYHYASPGQHGKFDLFTLGADGAEGGEGEDQDIVSWE